MPTFLDESGDTGTNPGPDNRHFRLAAVWVPTAAVADAVRADIRAARVVLGVPANYEFKFAKTGRHPDRRAAFFAAALNHEFRFAVCSVDKGVVPPRSLYWVSLVTLAATLRPTYRAAEAARGAALREQVVVDDNGDPRFFTEVKRTFRGPASGLAGGRAHVEQVRFRGSGPDEMVQLADMVCGATAAHLDGRGEWFARVAGRSLGVSVYG